MAIMQELEAFNPRLLKKPQVVVLNKIDLPHVQEKQNEIEENLRNIIGHSRFMSISAKTKENTNELMHRCWKLLSVLKK